MGVLDVILGRDENGNVSKINLALIALLLWRMYQGSGRSGTPEPAPAPAPSGRRLPTPDGPTPDTRSQAPAPIPNTSSESDGGFRDLTDAMNRMPDFRRDPGAGGGGPGGGLGGGLGDILGDILGGGGRPTGRSGQQGGPGGGLGDILGDILGGGRPGGRGGQPGGLGDILGDILGGGRSPARAMGAGSSGPQGDPFSDLLRGGAGAGLAGLFGASLGGLLQQFDQSGHGDEARSWIASGSNKPISPSDIEDTFGSDTIDTLVQQLHVPREELLSGLAQVLPQAVDQMTPDGRLLTQDEVSRWG